MLFWHKLILNSYFVGNSVYARLRLGKTNWVLRAIIRAVFDFLRPPLTPPTADLVVLEGLDKVFLLDKEFFFTG